jgi:protein-tyrosine phosphatase
VSADVNWVLPQLAISGRIAGPIADLRSRHGISRVVDLRAECSDDAELLRSSGIELLCLPTIDHTVIAREMIDRGVAWVNEAIDRGDRVLVHCEHGIGRSALLTLCILVSRAGDPVTAIIRLKRARPCIAPNPEQLEAFLSWSTAHGKPAAWPDVAAIAYGTRPVPDQP